MLSSKDFDHVSARTATKADSHSAKEEDKDFTRSVDSLKATMDDDEVSLEEEYSLDVKARIAEFEQTITRSASEKLLRRDYSVQSINTGARSTSNLQQSPDRGTSVRIDNERLRLEVNHLRKKLADIQNLSEDRQSSSRSNSNLSESRIDSQGPEFNDIKTREAPDQDTVEHSAVLQWITGARDNDQSSSDDKPDEGATPDLTTSADFRDQVRRFDTDLRKLSQDRDELKSRLNASDVQLKEQMDLNRISASRVLELEKMLLEKDAIIDELRVKSTETTEEIGELLAAQASLSAELEQKDEEMESQMETYSEALRLQAREQLSAAVVRQTALEAELSALRKQMDEGPVGAIDEGQLDYLHHIVFKYMSGVQQKQLVPVIATILKFSAAEIKAVMPPK